MVGVYCIKNSLNGKLYIGSSNDIPRRWRKHKTELKCKRHSNEHLLRAYHKYGAQAFVFIVLKVCSLDNLEMEEWNLIKGLDTINQGYNQIPPRNLAIYGQSSQEYRQKLSDAHKGRKPENWAVMHKIRWKPIDVYKDGKFFKSFENSGAVRDYFGFDDYRIVYLWVKNRTINFRGKYKKLRGYEFKYGEV